MSPPLDTLSAADLKDRCKILGLRAYGTKKEMIDRLTLHLAATTPTPTPPPALVPAAAAKRTTRSNIPTAYPTPYPAAAKKLTRSTVVVKADETKVDAAEASEKKKMEEKRAKEEEARMIVKKYEVMREALEMKRREELESVMKGEELEDFMKKLKF